MCASARTSRIRSGDCDGVVVAVSDNVAVTNIAEFLAIFPTRSAVITFGFEAETLLAGGALRGGIEFVLAFTLAAGDLISVHFRCFARAVGFVGARFVAARRVHRVVDTLRDAGISVVAETSVARAAILRLIDGRVTGFAVSAVPTVAAVAVAGAVTGVHGIVVGAAVAVFVVVTTLNAVGIVTPTPDASAAIQRSIVERVAVITLRSLPRVDCTNTLALASLCINLWISSAETILCTIRCGCSESSLSRSKGNETPPKRC